MGFFKGILGKDAEEKDKPVTQPLISVDIKEEQPTNKINIEPKTVEKGEKKSFSEDFSKDDDEDKTIPRAFYFKRWVDKKLTIILVENTFEVAKERDTVIKIIRSLVSEGLVSVINYGTIVRPSEILDVSALDNITILSNYTIGNMACLYDALVSLQSMVSKKYMSVEEKEKERIKVNKIEVIGIGTCIDNCSKVSKEIAIDCFCQVASKPEITTKYFCLTEETFVDAAEIGFRSIGAILRNY